MRAAGAIASIRDTEARRGVAHAHSRHTNALDAFLKVFSVGFARSKAIFQLA
jgi:hypothetical protein